MLAVREKLINWNSEITLHTYAHRQRITILWHYFSFHRHECGVRTTVSSSVTFSHSLPAVESCDKGDTAFWHTLKILAIYTELWDCTLTAKVAETVTLLACIWDFPIRMSEQTQSLCLKWFYSVRAYINKIQQDATVCRYLVTAKLLYMFRVSIAPIIRST